MIMSRSDQLRALLMAVIEKVLETDPISASSGHLPLSVSRVSLILSCENIIK